MNPAVGQLLDAFGRFLPMVAVTIVMLVLIVNRPAQDLESWHDLIALVTSFTTGMMIARNRGVSS